MVSEVAKILVRLKSDTAAVVELYPALTKEKYWVLVSPETTGDIETAAFLTYSTEDTYVELPIFTSNEIEVFKSLRQQFAAKDILSNGYELFTRLKDILEGKMVVAINPGTETGIRLTKEMLLSAIACASAREAD